MKRILPCLRLLLISLPFCLLPLTGCGSSDGKETIEHDTLALLTTKIQQCSRLYSAEYRVRKIVTHEDAVRLQGSLFNQQFSITMPFSSRKLAVPIDATLKGCIDFSAFGKDNVHRIGKKIELVLPDPQIILTSSRIDHSKVKRYAALLRSNFTDKEMTHLAQEGRRSILEDIAKSDIVERTRINAARLLIPILMQLGFEEQDITVTYRKDFDAQQLDVLTPSPQPGR